MCCAYLVRASDRSRPGPRCGPCSLAAIVRNRRGLADLPGLARACRASIIAATRRGAATCPGSHRPEEALPSLRGHPRRGATPREDAAQREAARGDVSRGGLVHPRYRIAAARFSARSPQFAPTRKPPFRRSAACGRSSIVVAARAAIGPPRRARRLFASGGRALGLVRSCCPFGRPALPSSRSAAGPRYAVGNLSFPLAALRAPQGPGMHQPLFCVVPPCLY